MLDQTLPETLLAGVVGSRIGDVVAGSGHDDLIIETTGTTRTIEGVRPRSVLTTERRVVDLSTYPAGRLARSLGPLRRLLWWIASGWLEFVRGRPGQLVDAPELLVQGVSTILTAIVSFVVLSAFPRIEAAAVASHHPLIGRAALWSASALMVWALTGMVAALAMDANRWNPRTRPA